MAQRWDWGECGLNGKTDVVYPSEDGPLVQYKDYQSLQAALQWLDEFVTEPEFFPNEGDRQFWNEKRKAIQNLIKEDS